MNKFALAAALAFAVCGVAQGKMIDLVPGTPAGTTASGYASVGGPSRAQALNLSRSASELPEPEVFAMMLVGLVLIGYRARRESSEKFK